MEVILGEFSNPTKMIEEIETMLMTVSAHLMPEIYPGLSPAEYWTVGIIGAIILFISVLLHELAHSIIALTQIVGCATGLIAGVLLS